MFPTRHVDVTILTHESITPPYDEAVVTMLTGYFHNRSVLQTYICVHTVASHDASSETFHKCAVLLDEDRYRKTLIDNTRMLKVVPAQQVLSDIMIILCHGTRSTNTSCSNLRFCDNHSHQKYQNDPLNISACARLSKTEVTLKDVIGSSLLVFLNCCAGCDIVPEYLTEAASGGPDIIFFDAYEMKRMTHHIFFEWLFSLVESDNHPTKNQLAKIKTSIMRMMSIVKMFKNDGDSFLEFMQTIGMISNATDVKTMQQLPCPSYFHAQAKGKLHRYPGDFSTFLDLDDDPLRYSLLRDFRNLCFVTWDNSEYKRHSVWTATDVQFSPDSELDVYLKRYHQLKHAPVHDIAHHVHDPGFSGTSSEDSGDDITHVRDPGFSGSSSEDSGDDITQYVRDMGFHDSSSEDSGHAMGNSDSSSDDY